jgi:putative transposase
MKPASAFDLGGHLKTGHTWSLQNRFRYIGPSSPAGGSFQRYGAWTGRPKDAFPEDTVPGYPIRDRDRTYGEDFRIRVRGLKIQEAVIAPRSPWQNPFAERLVGSIRRECWDHVIVLGEGHLRKILKSYFDYYHQSRTHLSLAKDAPVSREVQPPEMGEVIELSQVGGLYHRYERRAA